MKKHYCEVCGRVTLHYMNFPVNFELKERSERVVVCRECWNVNAIVYKAFEK